MPAARPRARPRLAAGRGARGLGRGGARAESTLAGATELDPFPHGQPFAFEAQRPGDRRARARRGRERARRASSAPGNRVVVAFPHRGEALRTQSLLRKVERASCSSRARRCRASRSSASPSRRRAAASSGASSGSSCSPTRRSSASARRAPTRGSAARSQSFADLRTGDYVVHEDHGVGKLLGFETKEVAGVTRDYLFLAFRGEDRLYVPHEQLGKVSRYIGADATAPALSKLGGKAWQNLKARARESVRELAGELLALYAQRQQAAGRRVRPLATTGSSGSRPTFPYRETDDQQRAIEAVKEDLESPRPMDRLVCGDVGFGKTEVAVRAAFAVAVNGRQVLVLVPDDDPRRAALEHVPRALPRLPGPRRDGLALPQARGGEAGARATSPRARSTSSSARTASSRAT